MQQTSNPAFDERAAELEKLWVSHYDEGVPRRFDYDGTTLKERLLAIKEEQPEHPHIIFEGKTWTWGESDALACQLAHALLRLGAQKGDRVALVLPNIPEMVFAYMAGYKTGLILVGANPRYTETELAYNLKDNGAKFAIVCDDVVPMIKSLIDAGEVDVEQVIVVSQEDPAKLPYPEFYSFIADEPTTEPEADISPDDICMLAYTGGTTGVSKGCCYTVQMIYMHAKAWEYWFSPLVKGTDIKILDSLPMTHAYSITCAINLPIVSGGTVIIEQSANLDKVVDDINTYEPNIWPSIPAYITPLANRDDLSETKIASIDIILCGTAPLPEETLRRFHEATTARLIEGYGLSESVSCVSFNPMGMQKANSIGIPICNTDAVIVDTEEGTELVDNGELGEIIFRGPQLIHEYWNNPEETSLCVVDGWGHTGDIGFFDEDGYLHIHSRKKNMIIVGGFNVFPQDVDEIICLHPSVMESTTVGAPHERLGEVAVSFVVPREGCSIAFDELETWCRDRLTGYKVPKLFVILRELPRTHVGKPDTMKMKQLAAELYDPGE